MEAKEAMAGEKQKELAIQEFRESVRASTDLSDELKQLVDHVKMLTGSTAVYIGKVVLPIKKIDDEADDTSHIKAGAQPEIQFMHSSAEHQFMIDKVL